jgi:hypothetical protein
MYTLCGNPVNSLHDFGDEEVFIAYGVDKCTADDFDLDLIEFRNVQVPYLSLKLSAEKCSSPTEWTSAQLTILTSTS